MENTRNKILVIEDHHDVRENIAEILTLAGYEVLTAENGKRGVEMAIQASPDLILCDIMMPELDGFGVLRIIGSNPAIAGVPFIFLTAKAEKDDFRRGMGLGADDYITKPFDDVNLLDTVEMRLKKNRRLRSSFDGTEAGLQRFFDEAKAQDKLLQLTQDREVRNYARRDVIYREGQLPRWLFFVVSGRAKVFRTNDTGKELITKICVPGEFFGILPLIQDTIYNESATALEDCEIRLIPKDDFLNVLFSQKDVSVTMIRLLAGQLEEVEDNLLRLAYDAVRNKVARSLLMLYDRYAVDGVARIPLLREDLASLAGTAKETLIRTISDFRDEGLIDISDNDIIIGYPERLRVMPY